MSMATSMDTQSPALHVADCHDLIRVHGFMPTLARPEVDVLEGLTTAIIVDQQRMGADARSTVGTATDANAMLRILFSRLGQPHIGPPNAYSFNVASVHASGAITVERGARRVPSSSPDSASTAGTAASTAAPGSSTPTSRSARTPRPSSRTCCTRSRPE